jgi:hypothetical protein
MFESETIGFLGVVDYLAEHEGRDVLLLVSGPEDDDPVILRVEGKLGGLEVVDEGQAEGGTVGTSSYRVGDALVSLYGPDVTRAERLAEQEWVIVWQRHACFEFRFRR